MEVIVDAIKFLVETLSGYINDILQFITGLWNLATTSIDLAINALFGLVGLGRWVVVSVDFLQEIATMVPFDIGSMFAAMFVVSVIFVIFGRIK